VQLAQAITQCSGEQGKISTVDALACVRVREKSGCHGPTNYGIETHFPVGVLVESLLNGNIDKIIKSGVLLHSFVAFFSHMSHTPWKCPSLAQ